MADREVRNALRQLVATQVAIVEMLRIIALQQGANWDTTSAVFTEMHDALQEALEDR